MKLLFILILFITNTIIIFSNSFEELVARGDSLYAKWEFQSALYNYKQAYIINPGDYYILLKLTKVCNDLGEYYYELRDEKSAEKIVYKGID